jgi:hypothetical protein
MVMVEGAKTAAENLRTTKTTGGNPVLQVIEKLPPGAACPLSSFGTKRDVKMTAEQH